MSNEIERKFLVDITKWKIQKPGVHIQQGYLSLDKDRTVRVRIIGDEAFITVKGKNKGISRLEWEYPIPMLDALQMITLCLGVVTKTRYEEVHSGLTWEIDVFDGLNSGLIIAELELEYETQLFEAPNFILNEVDDPRYFNSNLINNPYSRWNKYQIEKDDSGTNINSYDNI